MCLGNLFLDTEYELHEKFSRDFPEIEIVHIFSHSRITDSFLTHTRRASFLTRREWWIDQHDPFIRSIREIITEFLWEFPLI